MLSKHGVKKFVLTNMVVTIMVLTNMILTNMAVTNLVLTYMLHDKQGLARSLGLTFNLVSLPKWPVNQLKTLHQSRQQALKAYCALINIHTMQGRGSKV